MIEVVRLAGDGADMPLEPLGEIASSSAVSGGGSPANGWRGKTIEYQMRKADKPKETAGSLQPRAARQPPGGGVAHHGK